MPYADAHASSSINSNKEKKRKETMVSQQRVTTSKSKIKIDIWKRMKKKKKVQDENACSVMPNKIIASVAAGPLYSISLDFEPIQRLRALLSQAKH